MKKIKTLSFAFGVALLFITAGPLRPAFAGLVSFSSSTVVSVSSQTASPTTILPSMQGAISHIEIWCYQLNNAGERLAVQSSTTGFSTSLTAGTAMIACTPNSVGRTPLILENYLGPIYGVVNSTYTIPVHVLRVK